MNVICLQEEAFYELVERVVARMEEKRDSQSKRKWVGQGDAMDLLNIKSTTTLQKLRNEGKIRYTHPQKKIILYDRESINDYLEKHSKNTF